MIIQSCEMALRSIMGNKMRSILTVLGIVIGVAAVVVMVGLGQGTTSSVTSSIEGMGTNLLTVSIRGFRQQQNTLSLTELNALAGTGGIDRIAPTLSSSTTAKAGTTTYDTSVLATTQDYADIRNQSVMSGRFLKQTDLDNRVAVAVIGTETATELFGHTDVVGETVTVQGRAFTIVGVLASKGTSSQGSSDDIIVIPFTLGEQILNSRGINSFYASSQSSETVNQAKATLTGFMLGKYGDDSDAFSIFSQSEMLESLSETTATLTLMLAGIAAISLLVGGIGIMNIMLVSVSERTREIGIRKAIGANRGAILTQFLVEALFISAIGGVIGLGVSYGLAYGLKVYGGMAMSVSPVVAGLAIAFSMVIGVGFGLYPADKASKLRPIEALRYEG